MRTSDARDLRAMEDVMQGIRSYGPGKFHTILDSHAYEFSLDGVDEELSLGEGSGWYGLIQLGSDGATRIREIAEQQKDPLTSDEEEFLDKQAAVIFFERSDGIVEATWYGDEQAAQEDWEEIEQEFEEEGEGEEEEEEEDLPEADAKDILEGLGSYLEHEGHDAPKEAARIARLIASARGDSDKVDKILEEVDRLVGGSGVEAIRGDRHDNYYGDVVALYVNLGDTYNTTLLYETEEEKFLVTSWGDWVEHNERKYGIQ